jgi:hypothetical protein
VFWRYILSSSKVKAPSTHFGMTGKAFLSLSDRSSLRNIQFCTFQQLEIGKIQTLNGAQNNITPKKIRMMKKKKEQRKKQE